MESVRKRGAKIHSGEREIIRREIECCDKECFEKVLSVPLDKATERAAHYCKVSTATVKRIRKAGKITPDERLNTPGKNQKKADHHRAQVENFDRRVIVDVIRNFYVNKKNCADL